MVIMAGTFRSLVMMAIAIFHVCGTGCRGQQIHDPVPPEGGSRPTADEGKQGAVEISPKCAAVLLSGATVGGAGLAYAVTPAVLAVSGFGPAGVSGGSFAAWWQSTMPLVQGGSLFATLQSAAMGGVGTKAVLAGGALGGTVARHI